MRAYPKRTRIRRAACLATGALVLGALAGGSRAAAQGAAAPTAEPTPAPAPERPVAPDSPRANVQTFLDLAREGRWEEAARWLELDALQQGRGPELARRLKAVLDRHLWIDLDKLSPEPEGRQDDGLPPGTDEVGVVRSGPGPPRPVRIVRRPEVPRADAERPAWVFSAETVSLIDRWYSALPARWLREHLPEVLLRPGPGELLWWQWAALPLLFGAAWLIGRVLAWVTLKVARRASRRTQTVWDDALLQRLKGPVRLAWTLAAAYALLPILGLYAPAQASLRRALATAGLVALFWALWRLVEVAGLALREAPWARGNPSALSLLTISVRVGEVAVLAMGVVAVLSQLGYPVASLLAGLGLGGLAVALAAQKTVENLFGSVSLGVDQPFRVGDFVRVEDFVATVEEIGLRSTRFRTLDRTLVTIPNGKLADMRLESYSARDRMRLACIVGLVYETTAEQMRAVLKGLEGVLRAHPKIWPDTVVVRFKEFGDSSLNIEIMAWFQTPDWGEFQLIRQEVLLGFMDVVEKAGSSFAFPTRTVHLVQEPAPNGAGQTASGGERPAEAAASRRPTAGESE